LKTDPELRSNALDIKNSDHFTLQSNTSKGSQHISDCEEDTSNIMHPQNIKKNVKSAQDVDGYRIAKYRNLIEKGLYKVDPEKVAQKIIDAHVENEIPNQPSKRK